MKGIEIIVCKDVLEESHDHSIRCQTQTSQEETVLGFNGSTKADTSDKRIEPVRTESIQEEMNAIALDTEKLKQILESSLIGRIPTTYTSKSYQAPPRKRIAVHLKSEKQPGKLIALPDTMEELIQIAGKPFQSFSILLNTQNANLLSLKLYKIKQEQLRGNWYCHR